MNRRLFLHNGFFGACFFSLPGIINPESSLNFRLREAFCDARFIKRTRQGFQCELCPNECAITESKPGSCQTRVVRNNNVVCIAYGNPYYVNIETPESQSLYHYMPETRALSVGTAGCNFTCQYCAVSSISQKSPMVVPSQELFPDQVVELCSGKHVKMVIYTFNEPTVYFEYMLEMAKVAKMNGIKNVMVSNGYINEKPLRELAPFLDAAVIHVKAFSDASYQKLTGGSIFSVFKTMQILKELNIWMEINHLLVPGWTDNFELLKKMTDWMVNNGFEHTPMHFSKFKPAFRLSQLPETTETSLLKAKEIALNSGLKYVYLNDQPKGASQFVNCPGCHQPLMQRNGGKIEANQIKSGKCSFCGHKIDGVW